MREKLARALKRYDKRSVGVSVSHIVLRTDENGEICRLLWSFERCLLEMVMNVM